MSQVYVVQESFYTQRDGTRVSHDYTSLYQYGQVAFLLPPTKKQMEESDQNSELEMLNTKLSQFNAAVDYLVFSGDPVLCGLAAIVVYSMTECDSLNILKWNRKEGVYEPVTVPLP